MQITFASEATPGSPNEDYVLAGPSWAAVLDGATAPAGVDSGCVHDVPWLVRQLAGELAVRLVREEKTSLPDLLADAIHAACSAHADTCDLNNPDSPSSTVVMLRRHDEQLDYLVLADSPLILDINGNVQAVIDDRTAHLPSYTIESVRAHRNREGGFWVASTRPDAAYRAVTGSTPATDVRRAALLSDGSARYVERFHLATWPELLNVLDRDGPLELIHRVRQAELAETDQDRAERRGKRHDDATAVLYRP